MLQIKTYQFIVLSSCVDGNMYMKKQNAKEEYDNLYTPERIDNEINYFCKGKDIIDIKVNEIYQSFTENSGTNKVIMQYTILYKEDTV